MRAATEFRRESASKFNDLTPGFQADDPVLEHRRRRVSTVVVQRFCKPKVGGSNPSPGMRHLLLLRETMISTAS